EPPRPVETVDGQWPTGPTPTHDVVVQLLITVDERGEVSDPSIDVSLGEAIDAAAIAAALRWRFEPARRAGVPVIARVRIAVRFPAPVAPPPPVPPDHQHHGHEHAHEHEPEFGAVAHETRPPRSASEVERDRGTLLAAPQRTGSDLLRTVPGIFLTQHGGEGKAAQIFYRGFDADHGQDLEIWVGGAPVNDVSNLHGQGYADLHFVIPEVVRTLRVTPGTYDPRQGDFAVAGSARFELGYDQPGATVKAGYGQFRTQRYFLAYRPRDADERTFGAVELYTTDGFGPSRAAKRASAMAQATFSLAQQTALRVLVTGYATQFDSAGVLRLRDVETRAVSRYATYDPSQGGASSRAQLVIELTRESEAGRLSIAPYLVLRSMRLRQNFTGYLTDPSGDSQQQLNDDVVLGGTASYALRTPVFSPNDRLELGVIARSDWIDQSQKRLSVIDRSVTGDLVDARVRALDVGGYVDLALHPLSRLTLRGGVRLDGLSYQAQDQGGEAGGQARGSQGMHVGPKATVEVNVISGLSLLASYGEGFRSPQARSLAESETTPFTQVRSFEGGARYANDTLAASIAGFRSQLSDDVVFDQSTTRNERVPATARSGLTLEATYRPRHWVNLTVNTTYTNATFRASDARYQKGDLVPYAPQLVSRADLSATPTWLAWQGRALSSVLGVGISHLARRPLPYGQLGHDVFLVDAQAGVRFGEVAISLRALNLLDARWYDGEYAFASSWSSGEAASLVPMRHVTIGAPRTVFGTLELYL
ncbi:MAG: TonB-dependent receptor, partial [Polyangiales bacterium]